MDIIAGVDEVGRGSLIGPVFAAAVIFNNSDKEFIHFKDSKKLSAKQREFYCAQITTEHHFAIASANEKEIDELNILQASLLAMKRAISKLCIYPDIALIDGKEIPKDLRCKTIAIINGDAIVPEISAASIVAKVARDKFILRLHEEYPIYQWNKNKGYGTKAHLEAISSNGITKYHRRSFAPCIQNQPQST